MRAVFVVSGWWRYGKTGEKEEEEPPSVFPSLAEDSGNEMWSSEWNIKQLAAAGLSGHRPVRGWTLAFCVRVCVCLWLHACMGFSVCLKVFHWILCVTLSVINAFYVFYVSWSFRPTIPYSVVCIYAHVHNLRTPPVWGTLIYPYDHHLAYVSSQTVARLVSA